MNKFVKRFVSLIAAVIMLVSATAVNVNAESDVGASAYGFEVNSNLYKKSKWYNTITTNVRSEGYIIGVCTTKIGMTRAKNKVSGKYLDQFFVKCTMKGRCPLSKKAGYSEDLMISSTLPSTASLVGYSPESQAGMSQYQVGASVSSSSVGISGSTTVTKKALEIYNLSDTAARLVKVDYDYENNWWVPQGYNTYGKYSYNESVQRMNFAAETNKSKYKMSLLVQPKFEEMRGTGYWTFSKNKYYKVNQTITFTTLY